MKKFRFTCLAVLALFPPLLLPSCRKDVEEIPEVTEIRIVDPSSAKLRISQGETFRIKAELLPEAAAGTAVVEWSIDKPQVAAVKGSGTSCWVTALAPGNATIKAESGKAGASVFLTVAPVKVESFAVPSDIVAYVGFSTEIKTSIVPEEGNAHSLNWAVGDPEICEIHIDENGQAFLKGLKKGECSVEVSAKNRDEGSASSAPKTIKVSVKQAESRVALGYCTTSVLDPSKTVTIEEGARVNWASLRFKIDGKPVILLAIPADEDEKSISFTSSNESMFSLELAPVVSNIFGIKLNYLGGFPSSDITVTVEDSELETSHVRHFSVYREAKGIPEGTEMAVSVDDGDNTVIKDGGSYRMDLGVPRKFTVNAGYTAKWACGKPELFDGFEFDASDGGWSSYLKITPKESLEGETKVTVTDQNGRKMSFSVTVTKPVFPSGIQIVDAETGKAFSSPTVIPAGGSRTFRLSDPNYKGTWSLSNSSAFSLSSSGLTGTVTVTAAKGSYNESTSLSVRDEQGANTRAADIVSYVSFATGTAFYLREEKETSGTSDPYTFTWIGSNTNFKGSFSVYDGNTKLSKLLGVSQSFTSSLSVDFSLLNGQYAMQTLGKVQVSWPSKHCREVLLTLTDYWGNKLTRSIRPKVDLSDPNWEFYSNIADEDGVTITKLKKTYSKSEVTTNNLGTISGKWDDFYVSCRYQDEGRLYQCREVDCYILVQKMFYTYVSDPYYGRGYTREESAEMKPNEGSYTSDMGYVGYYWLCLSSTRPPEKYCPRIYKLDWEKIATAGWIPADCYPLIVVSWK